MLFMLNTINATPTFNCHLQNYQSTYGYLLEDVYDLAVSDSDSNLDSIRHLVLDFKSHHNYLKNKCKGNYDSIIFMMEKTEQYVNQLRNVEIVSIYSSNYDTTLQKLNIWKKIKFVALHGKFRGIPPILSDCSDSIFLFLGWDFETQAKNVQICDRVKWLYINNLQRAKTAFFSTNIEEMGYYYFKKDKNINVSIIEMTSLRRLHFYYASGHKIDTSRLFSSKSLEELYLHNVDNKQIKKMTEYSCSERFPELNEIVFYSKLDFTSSELDLMKAIAEKRKVTFKFVGH